MPASAPVYLALSGAFFLAAGAALLVRTAWLGNLFVVLGSAAPSRRERILIPAALAFSGTGWLFFHWSASHHFYNNLRPLWVVVTSLLWFPSACLVAGAAVLWIALRACFFPRNS